MSAASIDDALETIETGPLKDKNAAFSKLREALKSNAQNIRDGRLNKSLPKIQEILYRAISTEKATYHKSLASSKSTASASTSRLTSCSSTLRLLVELTLSNIKVKVIRSLIEHILDTIQDGDGEYCEPIALDYTKCLGLIFSYGPHAELLPADLSERVCRFCLGEIRRSSASNEQDASSGAESRFSRRSDTNLTLRVSRSSNGTSQDMGIGRGLQSQLVAEYLSILHNFVSTNTPAVTALAGSALTSLVYFLENARSVTGTECLAVAAVNKILLRSRAEMIELVSECMPRLLAVARSMWNAKLSDVKTDLIVLCILLSPFISKQLSVQGSGEIGTLSKRLAECIFQEYSERPDRDQLHLAELDLRFRSAPNALEGPTFALREGNIQAEINWSILTLLPLLSGSLAAMAITPPDEIDLEMAGPKKRLKETSWLDEVSQRMKQADRYVRIGALQVLSFHTQLASLGLHDLHKVLELCSQCATSGDGTVASWSFLVLANCALQSSAPMPAIKDQWSVIWQLGARNVNNPSTSRAACHCLHALLISQLVASERIQELAQSFQTSMEINGPATCNESSCGFIKALMRSTDGARILTSTEAKEHIVAWCLGKWTPADSFEKGIAADTQSLVPSDLLSLVFEGLPMPLLPTFRSVQDLRASPGQYWYAHFESLPIVQYLLLLPDQHSHHLLNLDFTSGRSAIPISHTAETTLIVSILNSCTSKSQATLGNFREALSKRARSISTNAVREVSMLVFVNTYILASIGADAGSRADNLRKANQNLRDCLCAFIESKECSDDRLDCILDVFFVQPDSQGTAENDITLISLADAYTALASSFERRRDALLDQTPILDGDMMDMDSQFESQTSGHRSKESRRWIMPRSELAAAFDSACRRTGGFVYMKLLSLLDTERATENPASSALVDILKTLSPTELLSTRPVLSIIGKMGLRWEEKHMFELFERLLDAVVDSPTEKSSEVSLGFIVDVMAISIDLWVGKTVTSFHGLSVDFYEYLTRMALETKTLPDGVQKRLSTLLLDIWKRNGDYGQEEKLQSTRSTLFSILETSSISVKMYLADRIPSIFNLFTLPNHEALFDDIEAILPANLEWIEGYARLGIECVSKSHAFDGPTAICKTFAPQILYTWLQSHSLLSMPHEVFGYSSLDELCDHNKVEVFSQLLLLDKREDMDTIKQRLRVSNSDIARACFGKAFAYAVSQDASSQQRTHEAEERLKRLHGNDAFADTIRISAPTILAQFLISTQTETAEKSLESTSHLEGACAILSDVKSSIVTERHLAPGMQPSFKGKVFAKQVTILCSRAELGLDKLFSTANLTSTIRTLLSTVHPALGSLHTYATLKKLRLLISLAGRSALQGYPLESLIRFIRSLVVDSICADDAVSLLKYLFQYGSEYLLQRPTIFYGLGVLSLLSLKTFMEARPDSLTQESQYKLTLSAVQSFHGWLATFLLETVADEHKSSSRLKMILKASSDVIFPPLLSKDQPCALLVGSLLDDRLSSQPFLSEEYRRQIFEALLMSAVAPDSPIDFALVDDHSAARYVRLLWEYARPAFENRHVSNWVGQVAGKAYVVSGSINLGLDSGASTDGRDTPQEDSQLQTSQRLISAALLRLLAASDLTSVLLVEQALCTMFANDDEAQSSDLIELFPVEIVEALQLPEQRSRKRSKKVRSVPDKVGLTTDFEQLRSKTNVQEWAGDLVRSISRQTSDHALLVALSEVLDASELLAVDMLPYVVHLGLLSDLNGTEQLKAAVSSMMASSFRERDAETRSKLRLILKALVYILKQQIPHERTILDRQHWLDISFVEAAEAASWSEMPTTALFLTEISAQQVQQATVRGSRRSSAASTPMETVPEGILLDVMKEVDDPDAFYGVDRTTSFSSILDRVDQERDGLKSLMLHSARLDALTRVGASDLGSDSLGTFRALSTLDLNSLTLTLLNQRKNALTQDDFSTTMLHTAQKLDKWDIALPNTCNTAETNLYQVQESLRRSNSPTTIQALIHKATSDIMIDLSASDVKAHQARSNFKLLGTLAEIGDMLSQRSAGDMKDLWARMQQRQTGWDIGRFNEALDMVSVRETNFGILRRNAGLSEALHLSTRDAFKIEVETVIQNSSLSRKHGFMQRSLNAASYLSTLKSLGAEIGVTIEAAADKELASTLWEQGEAATSVRMLQDLCARRDLSEQAVEIGKAGMLAQLGHQVASARLQRPQEVIEQYLKPAIETLKRNKQGAEAGRVFYEFASFCDQQLQNPDGLEDFRRLSTLRERKHQEVKELETLYKSMDKGDPRRSGVSKSHGRAMQWFKLDDEEYGRAVSARKSFVNQSLENYLKSLAACDEFDGCLVRFFALWLEHAGSPSANEAVNRQIESVASWKFVGLLNQMVSRLLLDEGPFQSLLGNLLRRICTEHPYHGNQHIFASCNIDQQDENARSRRDAARKIGGQLHNDKKVGSLFKKVWEASVLYKHLAQLRIEKAKSGKINLSRIPAAKEMNEKVSRFEIPPVTLSIDLRPAGDYSQVPTIVRFREEISIAGGLSAPKILTARATDGKQYKQLFKGGNDDLRQDAIMEQVFAEVSKMLRNHKETRRRDLQIRTYKVIPLTHNAGIIEFVPNSIPLQDVLLPAHEKYYPNDLTYNKAREMIRQAAEFDSRDKKVDQYRKVTSKYNPVLRYFFFERFQDPDDWFEKRTAYTRTTAAISILGHILGLGDRHCHNILLDEKSGEVIHIDLGVAFEAGRVLPIPETVPFRLTRDIVDGMGITKTEGTFRRCCEFTLEALRSDRDSIMTLLNVLRYDPLHNWNISPLRAKKMQEESSRVDAAGNAPAMVKKEDDAGEAERALAVVEKKLSKTLSTAAVVNELIQQATDERNLALLFTGWAAFE
ncbi:hypothetical protein MBLNU457_3949t2 [Dothideomycetes sp. NU457]